MTILEATENGPIVCLIGANRVYCLGDIAYRFSQESSLMAIGRPVVWINGHWVDACTVNHKLYKNWSDIVTILD